MDRRPFWETKRLDQMTAREWESLCDGCGLCCLVRFEDEETGEIIPTRVHCRLFNPETCRCTDYAHRRRHVPDCIKLTPHNIEGLQWMPPSCAYRRLSEGIRAVARRNANATRSAGAAPPSFIIRSASLRAAST